MAKKDVSMKTFAFLCAFAAVALGADGITKSQDSVEICNSLGSCAADTLVLTNNTSGAAALDSAYVLVEQFDTSGMGMHFVQYGFDACWFEANFTKDFLWRSERVGSDTFKLSKQYFYPRDAVPLSMGPGESCTMVRLQIGLYLVSAHYPVLPKHFRGTLRLHFSNGQIVSVLLRTKEPPTGITHAGFAKPSVSPIPTHSYFLANGRCVQRQDIRKKPGIHNVIIRGIKH
jgi:hypothetical protein